MTEPTLKIEGSSLRATTTIAAPPDRVEAYVADLNHLEKWWPEHWRYRRIMGDGGPGTRYFWVFGSMGAILVGVTTVDAVDPGRLAYHTSMLGIPIQMRYAFSPAAEGTLLEVEMRSVMLRLGLAAKTVSGQITRGLERLAATAY